MSAYDEGGLQRYECGDCGALIVADEFPASWTSEGGYERKPRYWCGPCKDLHRGATARVEEARPPAITSERLGVALLTLLSQKRRGVDFTLHTSWASDQTVLVAIVRRAGAKLGQPFVGEAADVLERAAVYALGEESL